MTARERVHAVLAHKQVDRLPRHLWTLPAIHQFRNDEYETLQQRYPNDIVSAPSPYGQSRLASGIPDMVGTYTDSWGCEWIVGEPGVIGEVKHPPIANWKNQQAYRLPWELLDESDFSRVGPFCTATEKFVLATTHVRPFERLQFLRGTEALFMDIAYGSPEFLKLKDKLHEFYCQELTLWAKTDVDAVAFIDDWGSQTALLISPTMWRELFKPMYTEYCDIIHANGKKVFFHSDGNIESIYGDLVEIGIDAINSQLFCMDIERLGQLYRGKITFWGEIDRQQALPFGTTNDVAEAVKRVRNALCDPGKPSGVIAQCEWGSHDPMENIETVFRTWDLLSSTDYSGGSE